MKNKRFWLLLVMLAMLWGLPQAAWALPSITQSPVEMGVEVENPYFTLTFNEETVFDETAAKEPSNYTVNTAECGLTLSSVDVNSASRTLVLNFSGKAEAGNLNITIKSAVGNFVDDSGTAVPLTVPPIPIKDLPFTVKFDANGGSGSMDSKMVGLNDGFTFPICTFTPPAGKLFDHWHVNGLNSVYKANDFLVLRQHIHWTREVLVMPNWREALTVHFNAAGGSGEMPDVVMDNTTPLVLPECSFTPPMGKEFLHWQVPGDSQVYTAGEKVDLSQIAPAEGEFTITAVWQDMLPDTIVTVQFDANGGSGEMPDIVTKSGVGFILPECTFTPPANKQFVSWQVLADTEMAAGQEFAYTAAGTYIVSAKWQDLPEEVPTPRPEQPGDDSGSDDDYDDGPSVERVDDLATNESPEFTISGLGESYLQGIVKSEPQVRWYDRVDMPDYTKTLYQTLQNGSNNDELADYLIEDEFYTLRAKNPKLIRGRRFTVNQAETITSTPQLALAGGFVSDERPFTQDEYMLVDVTAGDRSIDYPALREGDVVLTSAFNGIFVTRLTKSGNADYEKQRQDACTYITTVFQAFDRDHPEIFWLSGKSKVRILTVSVKYENRVVDEAYFFFTLADNQAFNLRSAAWTAPGSVEQGLHRRDAAVAQILQATAAAESRHEKLRSLNSWLTLHNEYNTSADLLKIGNEPHECLSALEGRTGQNGPVCDGYSRAFKVICDKLDIPCVLADGYARYAKDGGGEAHMWNMVQMDDGRWYGVDVTWNDPAVLGGAGAQSGHENERYLLVGSETVINGLSFAASHPVTNRVADGGVAFLNGPELASVTYNAALYQSAAAAMPFSDVAAEAWFYPAVQFVYWNELMNGVDEERFAPNEPLSRAQLVQILYNREGRPKAQQAASFADVQPDDWFAGAVAWAAEQQIVSGDDAGLFAPNQSISREQLAVMLWRYQGSPMLADYVLSFEDVKDVSRYAQPALAWAVQQGIVSGNAQGRLTPQAAATRAEAAQMLLNFWAE